MSLCDTVDVVVFSVDNSYLARKRARSVLMNQCMGNPNLPLVFVVVVVDDVVAADVTF